MTLQELLNGLPQGTKLSSTADFHKSTKKGVHRGSVAKAIQVVKEAGYADKEAEKDGDYIAVYSGGMWFPWRAFHLES